MELLKERLQQTAAQGLARTLSLRSGIDLASSDYLGFANDNVLRARFIEKLTDLPLGTSGSRLLSGNLAIFSDVEAELAAFVKREAALLFSSGYQANLALLSSLLRPTDIVFSDALNHASIIDGIRLSRAQKIIFPHRDLQALEDALRAHVNYPGLKLIVTESLFSMEGTLANLTALAAMAERYDAQLIVDEAHSTGVWGASLIANLGLTEKVLATVHCAGKAMGASGAWIAGSALLKDYLVNFARPFIYTTAPIPALAVLLQQAIHFYQECGEARASAVLQRVKRVKKSLSSLIADNIEGPILPILIGENFKTLEIARLLQQRGWDVRALRAPTVPENIARLRITVKWHNSEDELLQFARDVTEIL